MNLNQYVTDNKRFKFKEFFKSKTMPNYMKNVTVGYDKRDIIMLGVESILDPIANALEDEFGKKVSVNISSGFRTIALNNRIHGASDSDHLYCCAVDIWIWNVNSIAFKDIIIERLPNLPFRQLISYRKKPHVHIAWNIPGRPYKREVFTI